jgi:hypothetical protein
LSHGLQWMSKGMDRKYDRVDPRTRVSFYIAFGVTPDEQKMLENRYKSIEWDYHIESVDRLVALL